MSTDAVSTGVPTLPPRAAIAQLSLQLRASLQDAAAAEAEAAGVDPDAAIAKLQARVAPIIDARRRVLDDELDDARAAAAAAVSAVRREASAIVPTASPPAEALPPLTLVIDAEAFARVIGTVLGEYLSRFGMSERGGGRPHVADAPLSAPATQSFWSQARHLDVILVGFATLIVLVILAAWIG